LLFFKEDITLKVFKLCKKIVFKRLFTIFICIHKNKLQLFSIILINLMTKFGKRMTYFIKIFFTRLITFVKLCWYTYDKSNC